MVKILSVYCVVFAFFGRLLVLFLRMIQFFINLDYFRVKDLGGKGAEFCGISLEFLLGLWGVC